jgi:cytochrome b561
VSGSERVTRWTGSGQFTLFSRILHWTMAAMILTMLFIGVAMVASLADYHLLVSIHRPLGIVIMILVIIRYVNRRLSPPPEFIASMSFQERFVAHASEMLMYEMMFAMPLIGWGMLSAARYPIVLYDPIHLPPILPHSPMLYAVLRKMHTIVAYLLFTTFIAHFSAVLFHTLILGDGLIDRMVPWRVRGPDIGNQR